MSQNSDLWYSKYLKYKQKYLDLKKSLVGSGGNSKCHHSKCSCSRFQDNGSGKNCFCGHHGPIIRSYL